MWVRAMAAARIGGWGSRAPLRADHRCRPRPLWRLAGQGRLVSSFSRGNTTGTGLLRPALRKRLDERLARYDELLLAVSAPSADDDGLRLLVQEMVSLEPGALMLRRLQGLETEAMSLRSLGADADAEPELREMAAEELGGVLEEAAELERSVLHTLLPKDEADAGTAILEIRAGTGGDEASIFAADLYEMYARWG